MSTGLFLVRLDRICMQRRISSSRPITGSSFPSRAAAVRSRAYLFRASYFPSGSCTAVGRLMKQKALTQGSSAVRRLSNSPPTNRK